MKQANEISAIGTVKSEWLSWWNVKPEEADEAWKNKLRLDEQYARTEGRIIPNFGIIPDIQPYISQIDGSVIESRTKHRNHLRDHGCIEVGNEKVTPKAPEAPKGLRDDIARATYQILGS